MTVKKVPFDLIEEKILKGKTQISVEDPLAFPMELGDLRVENHYQAMVCVEEAFLNQGLVKEEFLREAPFERASRKIKHIFWRQLSRSIGPDFFEILRLDPKISAPDKFHLYIPYHDKKTYHYFKQYEGEIQLHRLPPFYSPTIVQNLDHGMLSLGLGEDGLPGPFLVPGGRFNEMYGWDSYFITLGLIQSQCIQEAKLMVNHMAHQIKYYGKILNANRSYYLGRSTPPFFSSALRAVYEALPASPENRAWLEKNLHLAMQEYLYVWRSLPRYTPTGLSRYMGESSFIPPEVESGHFDSLLLPFAQKHDLSIKQLMELYNAQKLFDEDLSRLFVHDQSMRESGHDTTYRLIDTSANLNTVDLNSLLYKIEGDIAELLDREFGGKIPFYVSKVGESGYWKKLQKGRKKNMDHYLRQSNGIYFDYDFHQKKSKPYLAATCFYPLWAGLCDQKQADELIQKWLPRLMEPGGIAACDEESRGPLAWDRPQRQWDYPFGWAPHQILIWQGLERYGYFDLSRDLAERWVRMILRSYQDYHGVIAEKYDVVKETHRVETEYGNVGVDFDYINMEGFGWTNTSLLLGLEKIGMSSGPRPIP